MQDQLESCIPGAGNDVISRTTATCQSYALRNLSRYHRSVAPKASSETANSLPPSKTISSISAQVTKHLDGVVTRFAVLVELLSCALRKRGPARAAGTARDGEPYRGQAPRQIRGRTQAKAGPRHRTSCPLGRVAKGLVPELVAAWPTPADGLIQRRDRSLQMPELWAPNDNDACTGWTGWSTLRGHIWRHVSGPAV